MSFDEAGRPRVEVIDTNADGKPYIVKYFKAVSLSKQENDQDFDGRFELVTVYEADQPTRSEADLNGDGIADVIAEYSGGKKRRQTEDTNLDGTNDVVTHFPSPVDSRSYRATRIPWARKIPAHRSVIGIPTRTGPWPGRPVMDIKPPKPWAIWSTPGRSR